MRWSKRIRLRVRSLIRQSRVEEEIDEELRYHLERQIDEFVAGGMDPRDARLGRCELSEASSSAKRSAAILWDFEWSTNCGRTCDTRSVRSSGSPGLPQ